MPRKIQPWNPPATQVKPFDPDEHRFSQVSIAEKYLFDKITHEHVKIAGTDISFYSRDMIDTTVDPLYGETVEPVWKGPYEIVGYAQWPDPAIEMRQEGFRGVYKLTAWIPRTEFELANAPLPNEGDVLAFWNTPFFTKGGVLGEDVPNSLYAFNIVDVDDDGHMFDNPYFVGFKFDLERNTEFTPERRITPP